MQNYITVGKPLLGEKYVAQKESGSVWLFSGSMWLYSGSVWLYSGSVWLYSGSVWLYSSSVWLYSKKNGMKIVAFLSLLRCRTHFAWTNYVMHHVESKTSWKYWDNELDKVLKRGGESSSFGQTFQTLSFKPLFSCLPEFFALISS